VFQRLLKTSLGNRSGITLDGNLLIRWGRSRNDDMELSGAEKRRCPGAHQLRQGSTT
jgi:hypothetical protein